MGMQRNRTDRPSLRGEDGAKRLSWKGVQGETFFLLKEGSPLRSPPKPAAQRARRDGAASMEMQ